MMHVPAISLKRRMTSRQFSSGRWMPVLLGALALVASAPGAWGQTTTTTSLFTTPVNPSSGAVITMTAQVSSVEQTVAGGSVTFTDIYNGVTEQLGTVQVQSTNGAAGTAILATEVGGVGSHQFVATYNGTATFATSTSSSQAVNFLAPYLSATALTSAGSAPSYTFTATVSAFGPVTPTGNVTFTDTTSNFTLGTAALNASTLQNGFTPFTRYPISNVNNGTTGQTVGPAIGDFNKDGRPDYAVPTNGGPVVILLGSGNGTFTTGTPLNTTSPFTPTSVVVGDFNGDGNQDLAVLSGQGIGSVNIYLGNGNGTFQAPLNFPVAASTSASRLLAVGDFNRDGIQDLVATNSALSQVAVLLGVGNGSFQAPSFYTVAGGPWNVVVGDINQDGFLDLAVASDFSSNISVLQGNGDGTFKPFISIATPGSQVGSVAIGDFNGDGFPDLASTSAPNSSLYILLNQKTATPTFQAPVTYTLSTAPYYLTIGDFNRDGKLDILSANNNSATQGVAVLLGNGTGAFATPTYYSVGSGAIFTNAGDINGDDQVDLTAVTLTGLSVLLSGQTESAALANIAINGCNTQSVTATYAGDGNYGTSTSTPITLAPSKQNTTLTLGASPVNGAVGQQVTLTASISPSSYGSTTTNGEAVTFKNGVLTLGTAILTNGIAVFNTVPPGGIDSYTATYAGDCAFNGSTNLTPVAGTTLLASTITWPTPAAISYGTLLSATQLDATDNAAGGGTFTYNPAIGALLQAGTQTLQARFTPASPLFAIETATVSLTVNKDPSFITWPTPTAITFGTPLSGFQLDATANGGTVQVPLPYNVFAIYPPGVRYNHAGSPANTVRNNAGFDNDGFTYSTTTLGSTVVFNGLTFNIGPAQALDAVFGTGTAIPLPAGKFASLYMLGALVNNIAPTQTFVVKYTDNTTTTLVQKMSDWFNAAGWPGESVVNCSEKRNFKDGTQQSDSVCVYEYSITLDATKTVASIMLPNNRNIVMLAMDLVTPPIPGTFTYTPPAGTIEPVGTDTLSVTFTPTDSIDFQPATATVQLLVETPVTPIVTPTISWPPPAPISFGTPLSATQLDAVAMGAPRPTPVVPTSQVSVIAAVADGSTYNQPGFDGAGGTYSWTKLNDGQVNFAGTSFTVGSSAAVPNAITNGAVYTLPTAGNYSTVYLIGAATTNGQTDQPFILTYADSGIPVTQTVSLSSWAQSAGFAGETIVATTPYMNTKAGGQVAGTFDLYGYQLTADPTRTLVSVSLPNTRNVVILALGFGTNTQVVVPGTYTYTPVAATVLPVGLQTLNVAFAPTNTSGYTPAKGSTTIQVNQAVPVITWPTPDAISVGTPLSGTQLNAVASVGGSPLAGTYKYTPVAGTSFATAGTYTLNVLFTPTDATDYTTASASVQIVVGTGTSGVSGGLLYPTSDCCFFSQLTPYTVSVGGSAIVPTGNVAVVFNGHTVGTGTLSPTSGANSAVTLLLNSTFFVPGNNTVTLNYLGDTNYVPSSNSAVIPLRNPAIIANPATEGGGGSTIIIPYTYVVAGSMTFNFNPSNGSVADFTNTSSSNCASGVQEPAGFVCQFFVSFKPGLPGIRKGVVEVDFTSAASVADPKLYLFLTGLGSAAQISLSSATQTTLNALLNQPQSLVFNPNDINSSTLYVANANAKPNAGQIDTLASSGGALTRWNGANSTNLIYPADLGFDPLGNLTVTDPLGAKVVQFNPALVESTVNTGTFTLGLPTAAKTDFGGNLYIADGGNTPQIIEIPGETFASYTPSQLSLGSQTSTFPVALAVDNAGANLYVGDGVSNQVLQVNLNGTGTSVVSLAPCDATITTCSFLSPAGFAFDPNGDLFVIDANLRVVLIPSAHSASAPATQLPITGLSNPSGLTLDGSGNVYVSDLNGTVVKLQVNLGTLPKFTTIGSSQTTTVTNTGNLSLAITGLTFAGAPSSFTETDTCKSASIPAGGSCTITVTYANTAGPASDTLTFTSNAFAATPATIHLSH